MLLTIDAGNTQTVVGLFRDADLVDHWRIATVADRTSDELALMVQQFLGFHGFSFDPSITGVEISMDALFERAAGLRRVELTEPKHVIGKSTTESIQSGTIYGFSAQVDGLVDRFVAELGPCEVIATGGLAEPIIPHSRTVQHHEPWLTLFGLRIIFERNR